MKTAYYTYTSWGDGALAAGFDHTAQLRQVPPVRRSAQRAEDNVIDLNAWRAANLDLLQPERAEEPDWTCEAAEEPELVLPAPRPRRDHRRTLFTAELLSTLAVAGAAMALMVRVLMF